MQNLRDKLLKAGLVTEQQAKEAEKPPRKDAGPKGPRPQAKASRPETEEERQRREAFAAREAEVAEQRRKDAAKHAEAKMQSERARKLRALVQAHRFPNALGEVAFHFVRRSGKIGRVAVTPELAKLLESGAAAVVEDPGQPEHAVVPREAALEMRAVDPLAVRFFAGEEAKVGFAE